MKIQPGTKVLITGAASGIGRATALALGRRGAHLFLTDRNGPGLEETARLVSPPGKVLKSKPFDISNYESVKAFADEIHAESGPLDIIINNAGIALYALVEDMTHEHWRKIINVNLWGPIHGIECFLPEMIKARRGHLVTVSSTSGLIGLPLHAAYAATKFGLVGISEVLRYDLMMHNIGVTVVCPGAVDTPLKNTVEILGVDPHDPEVKALKEKFSRRTVTPERVADLIVQAVGKNRFLVLTSFDIKLLYFFKRFFFPLYHFIMIRITKMLADRFKEKVPK
jgi:NAD(P)-dependent dehydrogenase (short-subunit alcohol dehydrogenase family)